MIYRVWKDAIKDNWQDAKTIEEATAIDFGFGYDEVELNTWSKESHLAEINALHKEEFLSRIALAGYEDREEFNATLADTRSQWHEEAKFIHTYWLDGEITIEAYGETVTEQNAQDPQTFVNGLL